MSLETLRHCGNHATAPLCRPVAGLLVERGRHAIAGSGSFELLWDFLMGLKLDLHGCRTQYIANVPNSGSHCNQVDPYSGASIPHCHSSS